MLDVHVDGMANEMIGAAGRCHDRTTDRYTLSPCRTGHKDGEIIIYCEGFNLSKLRKKLNIR